MDARPIESLTQAPPVSAPPPLFSAAPPVSVAPAPQPRADLPPVTLLDVDAAGAALELLTLCRTLSPSALIRATRYYKWAAGHAAAVRAAREALGRELGVRDPDHRGRYRVDGGARLEFTRQLQAALREPASLGPDLLPIPVSELVGARLSPGELAAAWFLVAEWEPPPSASPPILGRQLFAADAALGRLHSSRAPFEPDVALQLARWLRAAGTALGRLKADLVDLSCQFGQYSAARDRIDVAPEHADAYEERVQQLFALPALARPPQPVAVPPAVLTEAGFNAQELVALEWMLDWRAPTDSAPAE